MLSKLGSVRPFLLPAVLLLTLIISACSPASSVTSVTTTLGSTSILVGDTTQAAATVTVSAGASQNVTWASSNTAVATVNNSGLVTAVGAGTTKITATSTADTAKSGSTKLTVTSPLAGRSVVYYIDYVGSDPDAAGAALDAAALAYGLDVTMATNDSFVGLLAASPDLVIYTRQSNGDLYTGHEAALKSWIAADGYLAFSDYDATGIGVVAVATELEAAFDGTSNYESMTITRPQLANGLSSNIVPLDVTIWTINNLGLDTLSGGKALATYDDTDSAAIVSGNDGRTMMIGFLSTTVAAGEGQQLYSNIFGELLRHRFHAGL